MKNLFILLLLISYAAHAQKPVAAASITVGSDFNDVMTMIGMEAGLFTANRQHGLLATIEMDKIVTADLYRYGKGARAKPNVTRSFSAHSAGLKYIWRFASIQNVSFNTVVNPWYSFNLRLPSAYAGGRVTITHKGDMVCMEGLVDPRIWRPVIRFSFITVF